MSRNPTSIFDIWQMQGLAQLQHGLFCEQPLGWLERGARSRCAKKQQVDGAGSGSTNHIPTPQGIPPEAQWGAGALPSRDLSTDPPSPLGSCTPLAGQDPPGQLPELLSLSHTPREAAALHQALQLKCRAAPSACANEVIRNANV